MKLRLTPPKFIIFLLTLIVAVVTVLCVLKVIPASVPGVAFVTKYAFWFMTGSYGLLALSAIFKGL